MTESIFWAMSRPHYRRHVGRRTARTVRRAGCCGLEALTCCLFLGTAGVGLFALVVRIVFFM
ncbi:MAG: hypothetical protein ACYDC5_13140 [Candidatus Dormibacteria bacterium]